MVFEHPGLLATEPECTDEVCITCSDEGRVAEVRAVHGDGLVDVVVTGATETVDASLVDPVAPGDLVGPRRRGPRPRCRTQPTMSGEPTGFLYPFIESEERDSASLLVDLAAFGAGQDRRQPGAADCHPRTVRRRAAKLPPRRWRTASGGAGGSSPSATAGAPPTPRARSISSADPPHGRPLPAMSLVDDRAVLTALANDVGFDLVFSRQIIAHARPGDIAVGFSTSGDSVNVLRALEEALAPRAAHHRPLRVRGWRHGGQRRPSPTAWSCAPRASIGSRRPRTPCSCSCGRWCRPDWTKEGGRDRHGTRDGLRRPGGRCLRTHRGVPPSPAPAARRGRHPGPRRRRQGLGRPARCRVPSRLRRRHARRRRPMPRS